MKSISNVTILDAVMHPYEKKLRRALRLRLFAMAVGLVWASLMGYSEFIIPSYETYFEQQRFERQLAECRGARASQRYDCKSELLLEKQASEFMAWTKRVVIVFAPPLFLIWLVTKMALPKKPTPGGLHRNRPDPSSRKVPSGEEEP
ncbi:MAG: hypothetical protein HQL43_05670 [Alphaproteobacteria bacterium]|nr:hypothetical protein [Alphaproteobacteria bacterium]